MMAVLATTVMTVGELLGAVPPDVGGIQITDLVSDSRQVRPGEEARVVVTTKRATPNAIRQSGALYVGEELAAEADWLCLRGSESPAGN